MQTTTKLAANLACAAVVVAAFLGCGGGGGGGGGSATVSGNVSSASTAAGKTSKATWLARVGEELLGLARQTYAAMSDTSLIGILVTVAHGTSQATATTDSMGDFSFPNAPTGSITVSFSRGTCNAFLGLSDVIDGSTLQLQNVTIACNTANPAGVGETFQGVLENIPASQNGNLNVCAFGGGKNHVRAVKTDTNTTFENSTGGAAAFSDFAEGDLIEVTGQRHGVGSLSAINAMTLKRIASGNTDQCLTIQTPTPAPSSTPTP